MLTCWHSTRLDIVVRGVRRRGEDESWAEALIGELNLRPIVAQFFLFTCHGINKKNLSCFFENQFIVLQLAVTHHDGFRTGRHKHDVIESLPYTGTSILYGMV